MGLKKMYLLLALMGPMAYGLPDWSVRYYAGTLNILDQKTKAHYTEQVVMYHVVDADTDVMTEVACVKDEGTPAYLVPTYMIRTGMDDQLRISDRNDFSPSSKLRGHGQALGKAWSWNQYTLTMQYRNSSKRNDFVTMKAHLRFDENGLNVKKQVWYADGSPKQAWSGRLPRVSKESFLKLASDMKCPAIP